jgi:hypothetical protein
MHLIAIKVVFCPKTRNSLINTNFSYEICTNYSNFTYLCNRKSNKRKKLKVLIYQLSKYS